MSIPGILEGAGSGAGSVTHGIEKVWAYDNITIVVLMIMVLLLAIANGVQFRANGKRMDKVFERDVMMAKTIAGLEGAVDELKTIFTFILQKFKSSGD